MTFSRSSLAVKALATVAVLAAIQHPVIAQEQRFQLQQIDSGYVRLDTATGEISTCTETGDQLVCRMAADERSALMEEMGALERRVAALEEGGLSRALPSDEEVDRAIGIMERFLGGFIGTVREGTN